MAIESTTFETIHPCRFTTFTFPNPSPSTTSLLRVAVLDSPSHLLPTADPPKVAAMLVPKHRHSDWIFSTHSGHLQLLLTSPEPIARLILVGDTSPHSPPIFLRHDTSFDDDEELGVSLKPLFLALSPKLCFKHGIPDIPILRYEDGLISSVVLDKCVGSFVGEMVVEDVEIECRGGREFRRRLRFKRMPNLVQTEVRIVPKLGFGLDSVGIGQAEFSVDDSVLVHPYLAPMVASLSLAAPYIEGRIRSGVRPKALCLGVGGGALLGFLRTQLGFQVVGVEADEEVLRVSRRYFGLADHEHVKVCVGDALEFIDKLANTCCKVEEGCDLGSGNDVDAKFDVIIVDLDASDARDGLIAPPLEFARKHVLLSARSILSDDGILAVNVIPSSTSFYKTLVHEFRDVFDELYEIDVGNGEHFVLIAVASPLMPSSDCENCFLNKLGKSISGEYLTSIKKV
ncbi:uncharacterized protein LOC126802070 [Argentina anserina]|uniref:uncharacterized protein LOC126802070 n=1 Tax=Argentina anserina TaxID=57926 RepID=UPI00217675DA|nr:uncharacterized protein LOC126802070 [Potentilla anserina]XP_050385562.1 uncharacterized protein LOC126802070 [Potentilla anserina]XP_050385563.1 uncharacterized protein LOC126802070 [Potentilla anserina]XP_050385564.1 uncharacterized protein LOC126802070 [Potentilla anserina]XP_050385565.1 uncharacterized protein LOC126802070 [Potentilla anserina]XP_050385566.1 uncharacterized protein LOC126802070 [Potentilla anserina]